MSKNYQKEINIEYTKRLRENIEILPPFVHDFFLHIADTTSILTRLGYSHDLKLFFEYLIKEEPMFYKEKIRDFTISDFKKITRTQINEFLEYLSYYLKDVVDEETGEIISQSEVTNGPEGKSRKLSAIRSLFLYLSEEELITNNPSMLVRTPKIPKKNITFLDVNEIANLLDEIEEGENLTERQKSYHRKTRKRDLALVMSLLGTGMRISECVGLDIKSVDFENSSFSIIRKGGNESRVYFNDELAIPLMEYIEERENQFFEKNRDSKKNKQMLLLEFREQPLFTSLQNKRINVKTVQNLVKKYSKIATPFKNISPHKLRSTYGTILYRETNDIYLVADALGHADINTTKKHYADVVEVQRRKAASHTHLRT